MSNQIVISSGAKVRNLSGVLTGTSGIVNSLGINVPDGIPQLDGNGKILVTQLPNSVMEYKGTWNVSTNTPTLANGTGNQGDVYLVEGAASGGTAFDFGAGSITFYNGDQVVYSGSIWQRASGSTGTVTSVAVTESGDALTITGSPITSSGTINIGFAGTGSQYIKGDGTLATFPTTIDQAKKLITEVYNSTGATLTKGTIVYINGGQGNLPTITKAIATGDATSAQTYGVVQSDITNMNNGFVVVIGSLGDLDTQAYSTGAQLYLSGTTAGEWTSTKPSAPIHLVYVGIVVRSHPTQGVVEVRIQNGYELDELHDVAITSVANNDGIFYNSSNDLWENKTIAEVLGYTPANDSLVVKLAGTQTITGEKTFTNPITISTASYLTSKLKLNNTATGGNLWSVCSGNLNNSTNNGLFTITNETLSKNLFVLSPTGKLAIGGDMGTTNPADDLGIFGTNPNLKIFDISGNGSAINLQTTNTSAFISAAYITTAIPLVLRTGNTDRLTIAANGTTTLTGDLNGTTATFSSDLFALLGVFTRNSADTFIGTSNNTSGITVNGSTLVTKIVSGGNVVATFANSGAATLAGALSGTSATFTSGIFNNGTNSTNGIQVVSSLSSSLFTGGIEFLRTTTIGGSKIEPLRDASVGGVGLKFLVTSNNSAETSGTYTTALSILNTGAATFSDNIMIGAGKYLGYSASAYITPEDNIQGARVKTSGGFLVESAGATFSSSVTATTQGASNGFNTGGLIAKSNGNTARYTQVGYDNSGNYGWIQAIEQGTAYTNLILNGAGGNVGIGTTAPNSVLEVAGTSANTDFRISRTVSSSTYFYIKAPGGSPSAATMGVNGTDVMVLNASGNVGIGTSSPNANGLSTALTINGSSTSGLEINANGINQGYLIASTSLMILNARTNIPLLFYTNDTERMRITSGGDILIGTSTYGGVGISMRNPSTYNTGQLACVSGDNAEDMFYFYSNTTTLAGIIGVNGNTTSYYSVSDYRAKQDLQDFSGLDVISKFKMYDFEWKSDGTRNYGGIAHEIQEILPYAVTGEKDGERNQAVDYSKIVPVLVKAIQELSQQIEELKNK